MLKQGLHMFIVTVDMIFGAFFFLLISLRSTLECCENCFVFRKQEKKAKVYKENN